MHRSRKARSTSQQSIRACSYVAQPPGSEANTGRAGAGAPWRAHQFVSSTRHPPELLRNRDNVSARITSFDDVPSGSGRGTGNNLLHQPTVECEPNDVSGDDGLRFG